LWKNHINSEIFNEFIRIRFQNDDWRGFRGKESRDFGGEERFRFLLPTYVRGARGGIFMYDITNYSSIAHIDDWLAVIKREIKDEDQFPIIVAGGKADLAEHREVSAKDGIKIAKSRGVDGFIECSSKNGENVEKLFEALTRSMLNNF